MIDLTDFDTADNLMYRLERYNDTPTPYKIKKLLTLKDREIRELI